MKALIIGGAGFIGSQTALRLLHSGHDVIVLDLLDAQIHGSDLSASPTLKGLLGKVPVWAGDVRNPEVVDQALRQVDTVFHFAACTGTGQSMYQIHRYADVNVGGTAVLAEGLLRHRARLRRVVLSSSRAVYGEGAYSCAEHGRLFPPLRDLACLEAGRFDPVCAHCGKPLAPALSRESDPAQPTSTYGVTKLAQEQLLLNACESAGISAVALRYQNVYGPGQSLKNPYTGVLSIFSQLLRDRKKLKVFEDGEPTRDFVLVEDVVEYNVRGAEAELTGMHILNVGTGLRQRLVDIVAALAGALECPADMRVTGEFRVGDIRHAAADTTRLVARLGVREFTSFAEGVRRFVAWTREVGGDVDLSSRYQASLRELREQGLLRGGSS